MTTTLLTASVLTLAAGCGNKGHGEDVDADAHTDAPTDTPVDGTGDIITDSIVDSDDATGELPEDPSEDSVSDAVDAPDAVGDAEPDTVLPPNIPYPGAPPNMPHDPYGCGINCLGCHRTGTGGAPVSPHPERLMCTQCHLPQEDVADWVANTFTPYP